MVNARSFLFPFKYSHRVAYVIEFSHKKIRMYAQGKLVRDMSKTTMGGESGMTGGIPDDIVEKVFPVLEIASPYAYSDLWDNEEQCCKIQTIQHSDILYIFNEDFPLMVLKRYSNTTWVLEELEIRNGPFLSMNTTDISIATDELEGEVQLTATGDVFSKTDVGRLVRLRIFDDDTTPWQAGKVGFQGTICVSDKKYYKAVNGDETGSIKPVHSEGTRSDGGVLWEYLHDGSGIVKITEVIDRQHVKGTTVTRLPDAIKSGTVCWELGMLHKASKYPKSGAFFRNRFAFLVNTETGPNVCLSYSGDYNNFADMECGEATAETAITVPVLNTEFNEGKWIYARDVLFVGTGASEFYVDVVSSASPLASDNVKISQISRVGSKAIMPLSVGSHVIFVDRYGLSLRDLTYNYYNDGYDEMDISLLGKHLFQSRITGMAYQEVPDKVLWCMVGDGSLTALTFSAEQEVSALSRHDLSGAAESLAVIPNFEDCRDELWLEVKRTINNANYRTVEWMDNGIPQYWPSSVYGAASLAERETLEKEYVRQEALYLDGAVVYEQNELDMQEEMSGLEHLEGLEVAVYADGTVLEPQVVQDGKIKILPTYRHVAAGLPITSQFMPQNIYIPNDYGSGIGQKQRINHVLLMLYLSGGGQIGEDEDTLTDILYRQADAAMNEAQELFTGNKEVLFNGATTKKEAAATLMIQNSSPLPMNILAIVPYMDVDE